MVSGNDGSALAGFARRVGGTRLGRAAARVLPAGLVQRLWKTASGERGLVRSFAAPATRDEAIRDGLAQVRELLDAGHTGQARSLADLLHDQADARALGSLLQGVVAERERRYRLAAARFDEVSELAWAHVPSAYLNAIFRTDLDAGLRTAESLLAAPPSGFAGEDWFTLVANVYGNATPELTARAFELAEAAAAPDDTRLRRRLDWTRPWIGCTENRSAAPVPSGHVSFAIMDYRQPGPDGGASSRNIGDWAQTLASLGHVVRHQGVRFHGAPELTDLLGRLQQRVRPELRLDGVDADVDVRIMQRDASSYQEFPPDTWALVFGWFMHPLFDLDRHDFPLHRNLQPIFVSFHCAKKAMLTDEAISYLREHAPIGCRDWTTVDILLSLDIPAFFSGCVTTTISTVFPDLPERPEPATLYVDSTRTPVPDGAENVRQSLPEVLTNTFEQNIEAVVTRLDRWRAEYTDVATSRLHVYLPCRSLGLNTRYEPDSFSDPRVNGLLPLSDEGFQAIRVGMLERLRPVVTAILQSAPAADVRALWRELNQAEVDQARQRHDAPTAASAPRSDVPAARALRPEPRPAAVDVVYVPRPGEWKHLPASLRGTLRRLPADATVWVVGAGQRSAPSDDPRVRQLDAGAAVDSSLAPAAQRDRLLALLPELVPADRAILLPVASVLAGDLAELGALDLAGRRLAARVSTASLSSGSQALFRVARSFDADVDRANELLRENFRRHAFDYPTIDVELLVLDLAGMRTDATSEHLLDGMDRYGLSWPNSLLFEFGAAIAELDPAWARVPTRDPETTAAAWVWLDSPKPWAEGYASSARVWKSATNN